MSTLVFVGHATGARAAARHERGARLVAWSAEAVATLEASGVPHLTVAQALPAGAAEAIDEAAIAWTRAWGKRPLHDGQALRDLLRWRGVSLWWWLELYLHHSTRATGYVRTIETFARLLAALAPNEVEALGLGDDEALLLARTATARGVLYEGPERPPRGRAREVRAHRRAARWNLAKAWASAAKARLAGRPAWPAAPERRRVLFFSHAAFWRERRLADGTRSEYEHYFDALIPAVAAEPGLEARVVALGPRAAFRRRGSLARLGEWLSLGDTGRAYVHVNRFTTRDVCRSLAQATREADRLWRRLTGSPGIHEAFSHAGVAFADLCAPDLAALLLLQAPWAVRSLEEAGAVLDAAKPAVVCLYAEDSGWGRAIEAAARARSVPSVGLQHGILYPSYFGYRHEADEGECPRPHLTAVIGEAGRRFLEEHGHYPPQSLVVTGSAKFDALLEAARGLDRAALRAGLGVAPEEALVVVASRFRPIRPTHRALGPAFALLVTALEALAGVRAVVKPHPAEPALPYADVLRARGASRTRLLPATAELRELLVAADALVTVESLAALEALLLGRPVVVLEMPSNLRDMVEAGAALGVAAGADPRPALAAALFDGAARERLAAAREAYLANQAYGRDGHALERIVALVRDTAEWAGVVG